jgi:hypothetical protein
VWRADSDPATLIATGIVHARKNAWAGDGSEPVFATMAVDGGLVRVCDSTGATRIELTLASLGVPHHATSSAVVPIPRTGTPLFFASLFGDVQTAQTSLP